MSDQLTRKCEACGTDVAYTGHRGFRDAHHGKCPMEGLVAVTSNHHACPEHKSLVWVIGPYSAFRACSQVNCRAGRRGKPWRYCAPRGTYSEPRDNAEAPSTTSERGDENTSPTNAPQPEQEPPVPSKSPATAPQPQAPANDTGDLKSLGSLGDMIAAYVTGRTTTIASEMITEALNRAKAGGPSTVEWRVNSQPYARIEGAHHKVLPRILKLYAAGFRNFMIVGPAGSGKTTLARDLARALSTDEKPCHFGSISCTAGMSESALTGRAIPNLQTGDTSFQSTEFVRVYEGGGVFLIDEVDAADPNVMLVINSGTANGHMPLPNREANPTATRHPDCAIICAANTWGTGADRQYVGRNQLDAAFLDRFVGCTLEVDYDRDLEAGLAGDANICARVWRVREKCQELRLRRIVGTRFLLAVTRLVKAGGETLDAAMRACTSGAGWTSDECSKVGVL